MELCESQRIRKGREHSYEENTVEAQPSLNTLTEVCTGASDEDLRCSKAPRQKLYNRKSCTSMLSSAQKRGPGTIPGPYLTLSFLGFLFAVVVLVLVSRLVVMRCAATDTMTAPTIAIWGAMSGRSRCSSRATQMLAKFRVSAREKERDGVAPLQFSSRFCVYRPDAAPSRRHPLRSIPRSPYQ